MSDSDRDPPTVSDARADATVSGAALRTGETFAGRYAVGRLLGRGAMGEVWAAHDIELDVDVALKLLRPSGPAAALEDRFRREVRLARRVTHKNAARAFDIGHARGLVYLTMEMIDGLTLARVLEHSGPLEPERVVDIGVQICEGLAAAHEAGVVHRDLKPANVMVESSGRVVITDFGVARGLWDDPMATLDGSLVVGTPSYMAPEQRTGMAVDARTDLFALGVILFEALTGVLPHPVDDAGWPLDGAGLDQARRAHLARVGAPTPLVALVLDCLAIVPDARPASARRARARLSSVALAPSGDRARATTAAVDTGAERFMSIDPGERTLVVLPMQWLGPPEEAYLAEVLAGELVDVLAMTRGLRVCTALGSSRRDPREVGRELGADTLVDATVTRLHDRIRITARLVDTRTAEQTFSERFEAGLGGVVELQDLLARKIAEALRQELQQSRDRGCATDEALDLYLRGRWRSRAYDLGGTGPDGAVALYEQCLALAPSFRPARAALAAAYGRMLSLAHPEDDPRDWQALCVDAVERAQREAADLPETELAVARMCAQLGRFREAAAALRRALDLAPTCAAAHALLGSLQCEAGLADQGIQHLELARELDPRERWAMIHYARHLALGGELSLARSAIEQVRRDVPDLAPQLDSLLARIAIWAGDHEALAALDRAWAMHGRTDTLRHAMFGVALGRATAEEHAILVEPWLSGRAPIRLRSLLLQIAAEAVLTTGDIERGLGYVSRAADLGLVDLDWLDRCVALDPLRSRPELPAVRRRVHERAAAIWSVE